MNLIDLFPITTQNLGTAKCTIGGLNIVSLAQQYGTPLYLYDAATFTNAHNRLTTLLRSNYPGKHQVSYASKAYLSLKFAEKIASTGLSIDVVSINELKFALQSGISPEKIHLHGNNKSEAEIQLAIKSEIEAIVVDSIEELQYIESIAGILSKKPRIWLRLKPDIPVSTHTSIQTGHKTSKFGIDPYETKHSIKEIINKVNKNGKVHLTGIHTHLGSQLNEPEPYVEAVKTLLNICSAVSWKPSIISPGGGWGVPYSEMDTQPDPGLWIETISTTIFDWCHQHSWEIPELVIEPGRWLTARAGVAIYRVGFTKNNPDGGIFASIDGGLSDNLRPALYGARYTAAIIANTENRPMVDTRLVGRFCESGDELIKNIVLPQPTRGDILAVPVSGAYHLSMASNYNLADRPCVLWVENGKIEVLQKRETASDSDWWTGE